MHLRGRLKYLLLFVVSVSLSTAYLVSAFKKAGVWGGALFVFIWVAVFWYQYRRSRRS
jgi:hypothetical protein